MCDFSPRSAVLTSETTSLGLRGPDEPGDGTEQGHGGGGGLGGLGGWTQSEETRRSTCLRTGSAFFFFLHLKKGPLSSPPEQNPVFLLLQQEINSRIGGLYINNSIFRWCTDKEVANHSRKCMFYNIRFCVNRVICCQLSFQFSSNCYIFTSFFLTSSLEKVELKTGGRGPKNVSYDNS